MRDKSWISQAGSNFWLDLERFVFFESGEMRSEKEKVEDLVFLGDVLPQKQSHTPQKQSNTHKKGL